MADRKGIFTPDQEKLLDKVIKFSNKFAEAADGIAIQLIDNQGIERILKEADKKNPEIRVTVNEVVDKLMEGLEQMIEE